MPRIPCAPGAARAGRSLRTSGAALALALLLAAPAASDPIFADELVAASETTPFRGGNVLGSPDSAGRFLGSSLDPPAALGTLVLRFPLPVVDGEGSDLIVFDVDRDLLNETEQAEVEVSADGAVWSSLGEISGGVGAGRIDFAGRVGEPVSFVRIAQRSASALDLDAVQANFPVPEPGTLALVAAGFAALSRLRRRTP